MRTNYDLSTQMVNDEINDINMKNKECKFIEKIRDKNKNYIITMQKLLALHDDAFYNLVLMCNDFYDEFYKSHVMVTTKVNHVIRARTLHIIENFKKIYKNDFEIYEYYLHYNKKMKSLDLMVKSRILNGEATTATFGMLFKYLKGKELLQVWKIDLKKRKEIAFWIASEVDNAIGMLNRYTYTQPVIQLAQNDLFVIRIPIFNRHGIIDHSTTRFNKINYEATPPSLVDLEKSAIHTNLPFDPIRSCGLEPSVHMWKNIKNLSNTQEVDEFRNILLRNFKILYFNYDLSNGFIFKIKLLAIYPGVVKKNKYLQFNIPIKDMEDIVENEISPLRILNTIYEKYEIRVGDKLILYLKE
jgi:hypothetical protein